MWKENIKKLDLTGKPLTRAFLEKAPADADHIKKQYGFPLDFNGFREEYEMVGMAIVLDVLCLILPPVRQVDDRDSKGQFPKDRILAFVCCIWFFTTIIPRLEREGYTIDIDDLAKRAGPFLFSGYGEENTAGLIKISVQYGKELGTMAPPSVIEWHRAFSQMIFIHYEILLNKSIDLGDLDLGSIIGKMVKVFLSMSLTLPQDTRLN